MSPVQRQGNKPNVMGSPGVEISNTRSSLWRPSLGLERLTIPLRACWDSNTFLSISKSSKITCQCSKRNLRSNLFFSPLRFGLDSGCRHVADLCAHIWYMESASYIRQNERVLMKLQQNRKYGVDCAIIQQP